jgi:hypothetical protein
MRRALGLLSAVVVAVLSVRCGGAPSPTASDAAPSARPDAVAAAWAMVRIGTGGGVASTAVVNGFRVHPDPGDDGVIHVVEGENVVVNAADLASPPPAPQSYLIVKWGDNGPNNQRIGCGPCRLEHGYASGRYTLEATSDDLQPTAQARSSTNRSISIVVEVSPQREKKPAFVSRFAAVGFLSDTASVGSLVYLFIPIGPQPGVTSFDPVFLNIGCFGGVLGIPPGPPFPPAQFVPNNIAPVAIGIPFLAVAPGTCTASISGTDANGPFTETSTITVQ